MPNSLVFSKLTSRQSGVSKCLHQLICGRLGPVHLGQLLQGLPCLLDLALGQTPPNALRQLDEVQEEAQEGDSDQKLELAPLPHEVSQQNQVELPECKRDLDGYATERAVVGADELHAQDEGRDEEADSAHAADEPAHDVHGVAGGGSGQDGATSQEEDRGGEAEPPAEHVGDPPEEEGAHEHAAHVGRGAKALEIGPGADAEELRHHRVLEEGIVEENLWASNSLPCIDFTGALIPEDR